MAGSIKGITIELGGDTTKLDKALQGVNTKSKDLQSELRQVDKLLKLDPSNVTLVAQKQKLLTEAVQNTSSKLDTLKNAERQVQEQFKRGEVSEEQYRALQREIVATEQKLNGYQNELKEVGAESKKTAASTKDIGDSASSTTPKMKGFSVGSVAAIAAIGAAVTGVIAGIKSLGDKLIDTTKSLAEYGDNISETAAKFKMSTDEFQKWNYIAIATGTEAETVGSSLAKLTKAIGKASNGTKDQKEAFEKLGVSFKDGNKNFRKTEDVFYDVIDALGEVKNETEADILANALFGRSFQDMNPLIAEGADGLKDLGEKAEEMGLILDETTIDKLANFNDTLDAFKIKTLIAFAPLVESLIPAFEAVAKTITDVLNKPEVKTALETFGKKLGEVGTKLTNEFVKFVTEKDDSGKTGFDKLIEGIGKLGGAITDAVIWFIDEGLPAIQAALDWLVTHRSEIADVMTAISSGMIAIGVASGNVMLVLGGMTALAGTGLSQINGYLKENQAVLDEWANNNEARLNDTTGFWDSSYTKIGNIVLQNMDYLQNKASPALKKWAEDNGIYTQESQFVWDNFVMTFATTIDQIATKIRMTLSEVELNFKLAWDAIVFGFKANINTMIGFINNFISALNNIIGTIKKLSGGAITIPYVKYVPKINYNAEGALFDKPTILPTIAGLQMVGEAGAEITAPLAKLQNLMINTAKETGGGKTVNITINTQSMTPAQETRLINRINYELGMA